MPREEIDWEDDNFGVGYSNSYGKNQFSMKQIIIMHIKKISDLSCQEFTASFWEKRPIKVGDGVSMGEVYHPDKRAAYINAVDFLLDILMYNVIKDKEFEKKFKDLNEEEEKLKTKFEEDGKDEDDWILEKQKLRRKLFGAIVFNLNKTQFFEGRSFGEGPDS